ncbi:polysaccharide deacetylase family protein [Aliiroseovarius sp. YM-037]|uniref:polysaccharide deacetylase family protein n=1 Tax=Aliiroseovarius sp. YM-037 TaxID=3341728 RepID=UPI003A811FD0
MTPLLKKAAFAALSSPPIYGHLQKRALKSDPLTILCYHTLGPDADDMDAWTVLRVSDFQRQVAALRRTYDIVSLDDALDPERRGERPQAVLTFDDGDTGLFTHLLPIVEADALPVLIYVATRQIETGQPFWFDRVMNALQTSGARINLRDTGLGEWAVPDTTGADKWEVISGILEALKTVAPDERDAVADRIVAQAPDRGAAPTPLVPVSRDQLAELAANPNVGIGAHSHCHSLLDQIPLDAARESVAMSKALLEGWTGQNIRHFAYPNGNYTPELGAMIADLGFESATVLDSALASRNGDPFALSRLAIGRYDSLQRFRLRLVGL